MGTDYRFDGFEGLEKQLIKMIEQDFPAEFEQLVIQIAYELQGQVKENTPKGPTGRLRDGWSVGSIKKQGDEYVIEVYTNVEYAGHVEHGHRLPAGGFVPGRHMMEISLEVVSMRLPPFLNAWLSEFISTHQL